MVALSALTSHLQGLVPSLVRNQQKVVSLDKPRIRLFWVEKIKSEGVTCYFPAQKSRYCCATLRYS